MFNNEDILMGSPKKPIIFNIVYVDNPGAWYRVPLTVDYTNPTTGQKVTYTIRYGDSYSFPCAIGDTVKFYHVYTPGGGAWDRGYLFKFFNGVNVSPTTGQFEIPGGSHTFTITGKSPFLNYHTN